MALIRSTYLKNEDLIVGDHIVHFDENLEADVTEEDKERLLGCDTFYDPSALQEPSEDVKEDSLTDSSKDETKPSQEDPEDAQPDSEEAEEELTRENLEKKNVMQLKAIAKKHNVDLGEAHKKAEIIDAILA